MRNALHTVICGIALGTFCTVVAHADPLPGESLKLQQKPIDHVELPKLPSVGTFLGHDELSTATLSSPTAPFQGVFMADDFSDKFSQPVVHVSWWGSYMNQAGTAANRVQRFLISFESDVPAGTGSGSFSHPGQPILSQVVTKGALAPLSGTFTETLQSPGGAPLNEDLYKYNAELRLPFPEQADTVYWLKIVALVSPTDAIQWGWHDRDYTQQNLLASTAPIVNPGERNIGGGSVFNPVWHFQDDAVSGSVTGLLDPNNNVLELQQSGYLPQNYVDSLDGPTGIGQFSKDLAFEL